MSPDREALRTLRDRYMRDMEARSYDEVKNKFLEELQSKSGLASPRGTSSALQRERGAGIWNKAFASASKARMLRSSIVLLAQFFDVEPEVLILAEEKAAPDSESPVVEFFKRRPARRPRSRGSRLVQSVSIGNITSEGGPLRTGSISQKLVIGRGMIINIQDTRGSSEEAEERPEILFLAVAPVPSEGSRPRSGEEVRVIRGALEESRLGPRFSLQRRTAAGSQELGHVLLTARPRIVHLSGDGEPRGTAHPLGPEVLAPVFRALRGDVECVVLSGCYAEPQAQAIFRYVPYVIGVKAQAGTQATLAFVRRFYQSLGEGLPIPKAFLQAVAEGQREGRFEHSLPVLLRQR